MSILLAFNLPVGKNGTGTGMVDAWGLMGLLMKKLTADSQFKVFGLLPDKLKFHDCRPVR